MIVLRPSELIDNIGLTDLPGTDDDKTLLPGIGLPTPEEIRHLPLHEICISMMDDNGCSIANLKK